MTQDYVTEIVNQLLAMVAMLAGPILLVGLLVGLIVGVLQAATQIQESTLSFVPKLVVLGVCVVLGGPWALDKLVVFTGALLREIATLSPRGLL